jgi:hypothetical protein
MPPLKSFAEAYKKKMKKEQADSKISRAMVIDNIARHMISGRAYPLEPFPDRFIVNEPEPGKHLFYQVINDQNVVVRIGKERVKDAIIKWASSAWKTYPELMIEPKTAAEVCRAWTGLADKVQGLIPSFEFADGTNFVTHRLDFIPDLDRDFSDLDIHDPLVHGSYPFFEFLSRCSSPDQYAAFVGSLFYVDSYMQQYLYVWGAGNDGKGAMMRAMSDILGSAFHSDSFEFIGRFWTSAFIGKRLIAFPDSNEQGAMQRGIWKQLTGGDPVRIELKGEAAFTATLNAKYCITSNFAPVLKMDKADQRRPIIVEVKGITGEIDPRWETELRRPEQLKLMVEYCCYKYRQIAIKYGTHVPIPVDAEQSRLVQNADEALEQKIIENFSFDDSFVASVNEIRLALGADYNANKVGRVLVQRFGCVKFETRGEKMGRGAALQTFYAGLCPVGVTSRSKSLVEKTESYKKAHDRLCRNVVEPSR